MRKYYDFQLQGLPEQNFGEISKNREGTYVTEFLALLNDTIVIHLQWIVSEVEWPQKLRVAENAKKSQVPDRLPWQR